MTAIYVTVWLLVTPAGVVPNIASQTACEELAKDVYLWTSWRPHKCIPYQGVVGVGHQ